MKERLMSREEVGSKASNTGVDLRRIMGGKAHRVRSGIGRGVDAMLAVYKDRFTYTFILNKEVASIHFDAGSRKIYFKGHNIQNLKLKEEERNELVRLIDILEEDEEGRELRFLYEETLASIFADTN